MPETARFGAIAPAFAIARTGSTHAEDNSTLNLTYQDHIA